MLSKISFLVLGIIAGGPINPYAICKLIDFKRRNTKVSIPDQTIYSSVNVLKKQKLIKGKRIKNNNKPDTTVYSITRKGEEILRKNVALYFSYPEDDTLSGLAISLLLITFLDKENAIELLERYRIKILNEIAIRKVVIANDKERGLSYLGITAMEHTNDILKVNLKYVNKIKKRAKTDLQWGHFTVPFWRNDFFENQK